MNELLLTHLSEIATPLGTSPRTGPEAANVERLSGTAADPLEVYCLDARIAFVGPRSERLERFGELAGVPRADGTGRTLVPGFVDCHTHLPWAGSREEEFSQRLAGRTYLEIAADGGGILSTVRATRRASEDELVENTRTRLDRMLRHGTTTAEVKSGYGLNLDDELKQLRAIRRAAEEHPVDVVPTLLAAHEFPPEYRDDRDGWVRDIVSTVIPRAVDEGLAHFCDVFCEQGVFTVEQSRRVLTAGAERGLVPRLHADEFVDSGGALLAAELGAASADHVVAVTSEGIAAMAKAGVTAVLLPGVSFFLRKDDYAPARRFVDAGVSVALATDCNPGSSHTESIPFILWLGVFRLGLSIEECLCAVTLNPACVLGKGEEIGSVEVGKRADLLLLDGPNLLHLGYHLGVNPVHGVIKDGRIIRDRALHLA